eukprot:GEMP01034892.1.p1 GENE.GEMP01034892.1~~GEMP01034892.1.p1  ORF type:complete len:329 (+),score=60.13 GEMP01034892.1:93-1079(+)
MLKSLKGPIMLWVLRFLKHMKSNAAWWFLLTYLLRVAYQKLREYRKSLKERESWSMHDEMGQIQACVLSTEHLGIGRIEKRTLFTKKISDVFRNGEMCKRVLEAAEKCSEDNPILTMFLSQHDKWHILNTCTNVVSEIFAAYHVFFNEARRTPSYYRSAWYCFTLTCQRTCGTGRFFITPFKPVKEDVGTLRIRIVLMNEIELRQVACGEIEPAASFFNGRHQGRYKVIERFADLFIRQLERVTGQNAEADWGTNFCGRIGSKKPQKLLTAFDYSSDQLEEEEDSGSWEPEDNCFLRMHVPFPAGSSKPATSNLEAEKRVCRDVVLYE